VRQYLQNHRQKFTYIFRFVGPFKNLPVVQLETLHTIHTVKIKNLPYEYLLNLKPTDEKREKVNRNQNVHCTSTQCEESHFMCMEKISGLTKTCASLWSPPVSYCFLYVFFPEPDPLDDFVAGPQCRKPRVTPGTPGWFNRQSGWGWTLEVNGARHPWARSYSRYMEEKQGGSTRSERSYREGGLHAPCIL
jgi:hypothetical protein